MFDKPHEECGVFGIFNHNEYNLAHEIYLGLYSLQHRGQLSCGIAVNHGNDIVHVYKGEGLVPEVFNDDNLTKLSMTGKGRISNGKTGIGHVRYAQKNASDSENDQPIVMRYARGTIAIANNGHLLNANELRSTLHNSGAVFQTGSDAELIGYLIARKRLETNFVEDAIVEVMKQICGAYSFVVLSPKKLIAVRDPQGFRPLCIGRLSDSYVIASESCSIKCIGGDVIRDVLPGEVVVITNDGIKSIQNHCGQKSSLCAFEHVYFSRPDSVIDGMGVHDFRLRAGELLAYEHPVEADVVIGVPDSGIDAAMGYSAKSGIPYEIGLIKNRYIGRTFIQNNCLEREKSVHIKLNPVKPVLSDKKVVLIDDSIVRGTTSEHIVNLIKAAGAKEIHVRISSPPFLNPCYFGTDISSRTQLLAHNLSCESVAKKIGADSLCYLSLDSLNELSLKSNTSFCTGCFSGKYPLNIKKINTSDKFAVKLHKN